ncbi:MAG: Endopolygalacturonase [Candidatus Uhrbacteria bacterium GW2011_GWF2_39_13]|uniref:Endopolygalacturonase n=1 Tax=Candidatus Uhrbacteria bacterium GW2011_GWF2_39_13 TaxID=1618995 RepID=A0A0G0MTB5_9BACT|nr:MAG: Endopolygalacturonase [Candidatus Uhrbacteria bacterium GW2011_GWF2_39_13]
MPVYYNVCDFGAVGDGKTNNTKAFQVAIDECAKAGGGIVLLPPGNYLTGTFFLKDNVDFHLTGGAIVTGSSDLNDYKSSLYSQKSLNDRTSGTHLIIAQKANNVSISGTGCIDGNALAFFEAKPESAKLAIKGDVRTSQMVIFCDCENVKVSDVLFRNSPYWHLFIYGCRKVQIHGIRIKSNPDTCTNDGLDIDSSMDVVVSDCLIESQDDCITLRANNQPIGNRQNCENISVTNCILKTDCCGIRVGVGSGEVRNAVFSNIIIKKAKIGIDIIGLWTNKLSGVLVENIIFSNFIIHANIPFFITPGYGSTKPVKNIFFNNIMASAMSCCYLGGVPGNSTSEIYIRDMKIVMQPGIDNIHERNDMISEWAQKGYTSASNSMKVPYGLWIEHVENSEFKNIQIILEDQKDIWLNAIKINDVKNLKFESIVLRGFASYCDNLWSNERIDDFTLKTFNEKNISVE